MSENNPYRPPEAAVLATPAVEPAFTAESRAVDAGQGWEWIASGFDLFKKQPGMWILVTIVYVVVSIIMAIIPIIGSIASMVLFPVFAAGLLLGCRALDNDDELEIGHLFAAFKQNTGDLVILGLLTLLGWIIVVIPAMLIIGGGAFFAALRGDVASIATFGMSFALGFLLMLALAVPLYMAMWFAPALIVFNNLKPVEALKTSFAACLKNIVPFLLYGVILFVLSLIAVIPFGLGLLVLAPVLIASVYTAYRDIFS